MNEMRTGRRRKKEKRKNRCCLRESAPRCREGDRSTGTGERHLIGWQRFFFSPSLFFSLLTRRGSTLGALFLSPRLGLAMTASCAGRQPRRPRLSRDRLPCPCRCRGRQKHGDPNGQDASECDTHPFSCLFSLSLGFYQRLIHYTTMSQTSIFLDTPALFLPFVPSCRPYSSFNPLSSPELFTNRSFSLFIQVTASEHLPRCLLSSVRQASVATR